MYAPCNARSRFSLYQLRLYFVYLIVRSLTLCAFATGQYHHSILLSYADIEESFINAPTSLVERLAEANLERSIRLRTEENEEEEVEDESHRDAVTFFKPFSIFHDSGLGTSVPTMSHYTATVASHTSFLSVGGEEALGRPRVPSLPQEGGRPFQCDYCHRTISMQNRIEWKYVYKHAQA